MGHRAQPAAERASLLGAHKDIEGTIDVAPSAPPELMTAEQVGALLLVPRSTVEGYARSGVLPSIKIGKHRRFVRDDVADFIEALREPPARAMRRTARRSSS